MARDLVEFMRERMLQEDVGFEAMVLTRVWVYECLDVLLIARDVESL
jgi:hypothetical protein